MQKSKTMQWNDAVHIFDNHRSSCTFTSTGSMCPEIFWHFVLPKKYSWIGILLHDDWGENHNGVENSRFRIISRCLMNVSNELKTKTFRVIFCGKNVAPGILLVYRPLGILSSPNVCNSIDHPFYWCLCTSKSMENVVYAFTQYEKWLHQKHFNYLELMRAVV